MIILRHGKFISGLRVFRAGDVLPDTSTAKLMVEKGYAEIVADSPKKSAKTAKKPEPDKVEPIRENVEGNS